MLCLGQSTFLRFNHPAEAKWMKSMIPAGGRVPGPPYSPGPGRCPARSRTQAGSTPWTVFFLAHCSHTWDVRAGQHPWHGLAATYLGLVKAARQRGCWEGSKAVMLGKWGIMCLEQWRTLPAWTPLLGVLAFSCHHDSVTLESGLKEAGSMGSPGGPTYW